jgi:hypothetical protein
MQEISGPARSSGSAPVTNRRMPAGSGISQKTADRAQASSGSAGPVPSISIGPWKKVRTVG